MADSGAREPEALPTAELECVVAGLIIVVLPGPVGGAAVSDDVKKPQKLAIELAAIWMVMIDFVGWLYSDIEVYYAPAKKWGEES